MPTKRISNIEAMKAERDKALKQRDRLGRHLQMMLREEVPTSLSREYARYALIDIFGKDGI